MKHKQILVEGYELPNDIKEAWRVGDGYDHFFVCSDKNIWYEIFPDDNDSYQLDNEKDVECKELANEMNEFIQDLGYSLEDKEFETYYFDGYLNVQINADITVDDYLAIVDQAKEMGFECKDDVRKTCRTLNNTWWKYFSFYLPDYCEDIAYRPIEEFVDSSENLEDVTKIARMYLINISTSISTAMREFIRGCRNKTKIVNDCTILGESYIPARRIKLGNNTIVRKKR